MMLEEKTAKRIAERMKRFKVVGSRAEMLGSGWLLRNKGKVSKGCRLTIACYTLEKQP